MVTYSKNMDHKEMIQLTNKIKVLKDRKDKFCDFTHNIEDVCRHLNDQEKQSPLYDTKMYRDEINRLSQEIHTIKQRILNDKLGSFQRNLLCDHNKNMWLDWRYDADRDECVEIYESCDVCGTKSIVHDCCQKNCGTHHGLENPIWHY